MGLSDDAKEKYLDRFKEEALPMIEGSVISLVIAPERPDPKVCLELGATLLLDKPLILVITRGHTVPANLRRCAAAVVEGEIDEPDFQERLQQAISSVMKTDKRCH